MCISSRQKVQEHNQRRRQRNTSRRHAAPPVDEAVEHATERPHVARERQYCRGGSHPGDLLRRLECRRARGMRRGAAVAHKTAVSRTTEERALEIPPRASTQRSQTWVTMFHGVLMRAGLCRCQSCAKRVHYQVVMGTACDIHRQEAASPGPPHTMIKQQPRVATSGAAKASISACTVRLDVL